jgi:adenylyltransferase/sulfurtransferase
VQAAEALKLILKIGRPLLGRFLIYRALETDFRTLSLTKDPSCPLCGTKPTITGLRDCYDAGPKV